MPRSDYEQQMFEVELSNLSSLKNAIKSDVINAYMGEKPVDDINENIDSFNAKKRAFEKKWNVEIDEPDMEHVLLRKEQVSLKEEAVQEAEPELDKDDEPLVSNRFPESEEDEDDIPLVKREEPKQEEKQIEPQANLNILNEYAPKAKDEHPTIPVQMEPVLNKPTAKPNKPIEPTKHIDDVYKKPILELKRESEAKEKLNATDPKGEVYKETAQHLKDNGTKVHVLNLSEKPKDEKDYKKIALEALQLAKEAATANQKLEQEMEKYRQENKKLYDALLNASGYLAKYHTEKNQIGWAKTFLADTYTESLNKHAKRQ